MKKAQELKKIQNLEANKEKAKTQLPFSLFNNPSFLAVARKVGVDVDTPGAISHVSVEAKESQEVCALESNVGASLIYKAPDRSRSNYFISNLGNETLTSSQ